jgi:sugar/nucleoside kinase (ribokinase family)
MDISSRFFCLDTVMIDVVTRVASLPERGGDVLSSQYAITPGGGFNSMSATSRHGMNSFYVGRLGTGPFSAIAREQLAQEGIAVVVADDLQSDIGFCLVIVDDVGERTFITAAGAEGTLGAADLAGVDVLAGDYVFLSGYNFVYPALEAVIAPWVTALAHDVVVALDPGPRVLDIDADTLRSAMQRTDWFLCNADEATKLTGATGAQDCASALLEVTGRLGVVVRDGEAGCVVATRGAPPLHVDGFSVEVLDTNGAGDVHNGVFLSEVARGTPIAEAATRANAAAAMAITKFGPATCPKRDDVSRWYRQFS